MIGFMLVIDNVLFVDRSIRYLIWWGDAGNTSEPSASQLSSLQLVWSGREAEVKGTAVWSTLKPAGNVFHFDMGSM